MRRTPTPRHASRRGGFTLVELLVAAALSLVVMTVLALAFQTGMQSLSHLKSVVGMAEQLRAAETVLKRDLFAYHLEAEQVRPMRVSESDGRHIKGYLAFTQGGIVQTTGGPVGVGPVLEGGSTAADSPPSYRTYQSNAAAALYGRAWMDHMSFTVRLTGDKPQEVFAAPAVGNGASTLVDRLTGIDASGLLPETRSADPTSTQLTSRWAEVTYLLQPSGPSGASATTVFTSDEGGVTQLPMYTLYRRQRVLADRTITSPAAGPNVFGLADALVSRGLAMAQPGLGANPWVVLGPEGLVGGLAGVANRLGGANDPLAPAVPGALPPPFQQDLQRRGYPIPSGTAEYGSDVVLNNVVSMTIRPVYEFDVSPQVAGQLQSLITAGTVTLANLSPLPKAFQTPAVNSANNPSDWLELADIPPGSAGTRVTVASPGLFPRFYDTAGPSKKAIIFRNGPTGPILNINWDQGPGVTEISARLKGIEVKLRVYDSKNKTSRQLTLVQDL